MSTEKALNINSLNLTDKKLLEEILAKDLNDLTVYDIKVLKARRAYLTSEQVEYLKDALNDKYMGIDFKGEEKDVVVPEVKEIKVDDSGRRIIDPEDFSRDVLIQMCKDAELNFDLKATKKDLAELLNNR